MVTPRNHEGHPRRANEIRLHLPRHGMFHRWSCAPRARGSSPRRGEPWMLVAPLAIRCYLLRRAAGVVSRCLDPVYMHLCAGLLLHLQSMRRRLGRRRCLRERSRRRRIWGSLDCAADAVTGRGSYSVVSWPMFPWPSPVSYDPVWCRGALPPRPWETIGASLSGMMSGWLLRSMQEEDYWERGRCLSTGKTWAIRYAGTLLGDFPGLYRSIRSSGRVVRGSGSLSIDH